MNIEHLLADRTEVMGVNAIREILKVVSQPGMVSLAGGIPAPESFPLGILQELGTIVQEKYGAGAFQYDATEGFAPLRAALVDYLAGRGIRATADDILVASGSQGVLDSMGKVFLNRGDLVAVEAPTYLGALQAFNPYEPRYVQIATDGDGVIPAALEEVVRSRQIKFIYLTPTFQNPTGRTLSLARRQEVARLIQQYNVMLIEDDPYSDLRYHGKPLPPIKTFAPDHVVYVSTLSKVFAPGLRIGFCAAPPAVRKWLVIVKQGVDLHTSTYNQALATEYLAGGYLRRHLPNIIELYRPRQLAMLHALDRHLPEGFTWSQPAGGMFIWVEGPPGLDAEALYWQAVARKVAFVPGKFFFARRGDGLATMRLNFTMVDETTIDRALCVLAEAIAAMQTMGEA
ncbi:MAG: PLP-dependent aminotransferase family protein [Chloroflexi bacterium]|nr:MAG: PLP-dependent aminotransferase family protein [Chloroflexota bacterium]